MTLSDKIITLAALDMPPLMISSELDHQYQRDVIVEAVEELRRKHIIAPKALTVEEVERRAIKERERRRQKNAARRAKRAALRWPVAAE